MKILALHDDQQLHGNQTWRLSKNLCLYQRKCRISAPFMERLLCSIITDISYIGGLNNRPTLRKCFLINGRGSCMIWLLKRLGYLVCTLVFCSNLLHLRKVAFFKNMICNLNKLNKLLFIYNIFVFILFSMKYVTFSQYILYQMKYHFRQIHNRSSFADYLKFILTLQTS